MISPGIAPHLIGRSREIGQIERLLTGSRLVTVMGAPGAGKTRLAYEAASRLADEFPGGVHICELASVVDPTLARTAIASALGFVPEVAGDLGTLIADRFGDSATLVVIDNCEHVRAEVAQTVVNILSAQSGLRILATSRERLRVTGETAWSLPSLSQEDALQLLAERVAAVDAEFEVDDGNRSALVEICDRLERLPLALELVAARLALLPASEVARMLDRALDLLTGGDSGRHRTMTAALDWSVALLPPASAQDLWRLSVFPAAFSLEAAATVLEGTSAQALDRLGVLRDASLLVADTSDTSARFRLLEPVRQYALGHLERESIEEEVRRRHAMYVVGRAKWIGDRILGTAEQAAALQAFEELLPDLRAAFAWSYRNQPSWAGAIMGHSGWAWEITGRVREGEARERQAVEVTSDPTDRARLFVRLAGLSQRRDGQQAANDANRGIAEARLGNSRQELAFALSFSGGYDFSDSGEAKFAEADAIGNETADVLVPAWVSTFRGIRCEAEGRWKDAQEHHDRARAICEQLGDSWLTTQTTANLIGVSLRAADLPTASKHLRTALRRLTEHPDWIATIYVLAQAALLAAQTGRAADALRLVSVCQRLRDEIGLPFTHLVDIERTARRALGGESKPARQMKIGERLDVKESLKLALDVVETPGRFIQRRITRRDPVTGLTQREDEVVRLVAAGLTNKAIAAKLFMTERSAEGHVERIRNKLDVHSRSEIAMWAEEHGLVPVQATQQV